MFRKNPQKAQERARFGLIQITSLKVRKAVAEEISL
jgi:hypothetical protein